MLNKETILIEDVPAHGLTVNAKVVGSIPTRRHSVLSSSHKTKRDDEFSHSTRFVSNVRQTESLHTRFPLPGYAGKSVKAPINGNAITNN